jgi:hypothetical protein
MGTNGNEIKPVNSSTILRDAGSSKSGEQVSSVSIERQSQGGPRTELGKRRASRNATKHGLYSRVVLLKGESKGDYDKLVAGLYQDRQPVGTLEELLVDKLAAMLWRHRRLISMEVAELKRTKEAAPFVEDVLSGKGPDMPVLDRFVRCEAAFERSVDRILYHLERLQRMRRGQPVPPEQRVRLEL